MAPISSEKSHKDLLITAFRSVSTAANPCQAPASTVKIMIERQRQDQCPKHYYFDRNGRFHMQIIPQDECLSSQKTPVAPKPIM